MTPATPVTPSANETLPTTPVIDVEQLVAHFQRGCKTGPLRIGLEHEKIGMALDADGGCLLYTSRCV